MTRRTRRAVDPDDWSADPRAQQWINHVRHQVIPMIDESAMTMVITPDGEPDVKIAVELGLSILLDKPIIACVPKGMPVSPRLLRVADEVIEVDYGNLKASQDELHAAMDRVLKDG